MTIGIIVSTPARCIAPYVWPSRIARVDVRCDVYSERAVTVPQHPPVVRSVVLTFIPTSPPSVWGRGLPPLR